MCVLGILGIILMIIENELTFSQIDNNDTISSWSIKIVISFSTLVLIGFIFQYHHLDLSLYAVNNSIEDYRIAITYKKIFLILLEILVCAVHPMPRSFPRPSNSSVENTSSNSSTPTRYPLSYVSVDVALGFPMFARVYLLCRFIMFHSHVFHDISSRSIGYLNRVSIDYLFLIKAYLQQYPASCLTTLCIIVFFIGSWCTRACDYTPTNEHVSMSQAMWFFIVTFTTIGYGDFTPSTYCGRIIASIVGIFGILVVALLITVLAQKFLLNRWEKYVHSFVLNVELAKNRKMQAANIIKFAFQAWHLKKKNISESSIRYLQAQQRLFQSIRSLHEIKQKQRQLVDNCVDQIDIISVQHLSLYAVNNSIEDSRVTLTNRKIFLIVLEILICAIHPMPRSFPHRLNASVENISSNSSISTPYSSSYIDIDVALGLPMFARGYLLCRFIVFHSHLFLDASSRSIGYLNQISINYFFLIKVYVQQWPRRCIMTFCIMVFLIGSWCLRACDYTSNNEHLSMLDSMWLFIITFTTVGYGDIAPSTYCGRSIATIIGFLGVILIALLISVLTQKLLLDRSEKYVHNFVLNIQLAKEYKIEAANIIKFAFRVWYMKKKNISLSSIHYLQAQRRLFQSIQSLQQNKQEQRKLIDSCIDQIDLIAMHRNTTVQTYEAKELLKKTKVKIDKIEEKLVEMNININNTINDMQKTLNMLFDKVSQ
ncbi:unnamed protein product [Rotaria sordida]|uniref:Calmodulin-binding domain-containing protein n=1 Tax=Rotaria sordida TaxID=392033 RepID=A0A815J2A9_9BILA|nr:unnamed protein product [Rotaria sordida]